MGPSLTLPYAGSSCSKFQVVDISYRMSQLDCDQSGGLASIQVQGPRKIGTAEKPRAFHGETCRCRGATEHDVIEQMNRARHLAQLPMSGKLSRLRQPAGPFHARRETPFVLGDERGEGRLIRRRRLNE